MSITAKDIQEQGFEHSRKGYDVEEVDIFLERVAQEVDILTRQNQELRARLADAEAAIQQMQEQVQQPAVAPEPIIIDNSAEVESYKAKIADLEIRLSEKGEDAAAISAAIISAQKSADNIRAEAREEGEKIYREAEIKARELIRDALAEKQSALAELERLKDAKDRFKEEYFAMIKRFAAEGEKELSVSTDAAPAVKQVAVPVTHQSAYEHAAQAAAPAAAPATPDSYHAARKEEPVRAVEPVRRAEPVQSASSFSQAAPTQQFKPATRTDFSGFGDTDDFDIEEID